MATVIAGVAAIVVVLSVFLMCWSLRERRRLQVELESARELLEHQRDLAAIVEHSLEAFIVIDSGDRVLEWNQQATRLFGWVRDDAVGRLLTELIVPPKLRDAHSQALARVDPSNPRILGRRVEMPAIREDGSEIVIALTVTSILRRGKVTFLASIRDITERRQQEARVRELNATLERRVQERTQALEVANRRLEFANRDLAAFTRSVSHDLRAPIRAIHGYSALLAEDLGAEIPAKVRRDLTVIESTAKRMESIVDDLMKLASIGYQDFRPRVVSLDELVARAVDDIAPPADAKIEVEGPLGFVSAEPGMLLLALRNLVQNALKFSRMRTPPRVTIGCSTESGERVFFVRDNGVGFESRGSERLFEPFRRLHATHEFEGTGLGLAIVKSVLEKHNGRVWAQSEPGQGAAFYFALPERRVESS